MQGNIFYYFDHYYYTCPMWAKEQKFYWRTITVDHGIKDQWSLIAGISERNGTDLDRTKPNGKIGTEGAYRDAADQIDSKHNGSEKNVTEQIGSERTRTDGNATDQKRTDRSKSYQNGSDQIATFYSTKQFIRCFSGAISKRRIVYMSVFFSIYRYILCIVVKTFHP